MLHTYYLGANTPAGFRSEYGTLQTDSRIRTLRILKGGSGCGKSTLMRTVAARAERIGLACELIPCSSDPDSLDGLVVPEAGLGIVDGTAPHVIEPRLCGVKENYVNLGACYDEALLRELEPALRAAKAANAACYGPAYAALAASAAVRLTVRSLADQTDTKQALLHAREQLLNGMPEKAESPGAVRRCFLTAFTPAGIRSCVPELRTLWGIRDGFGLAGGLIRELARFWRAAGEEIVLAMDPMEPDSAAGLIVPGRELGYWRTDPVFEAPGTMLWLDLERPVLETLPQDVRRRVGDLFRIRGALTEECVFWLQRAKAHHDALEALYRPAVDFSLVDREAEAIAESLEEKSGR